MALHVKIRLAVKLYMDGRDWIASCPSIDVVSQARTKAAAQRSLQEAIELWFESCIERGVLPNALVEAGFSRLGPEDMIPERADIVETFRPEAVPAEEDQGGQQLVTDPIPFSYRRKRGQEFLEGFIPEMLSNGGPHLYASTQMDGTT